MAAVLITGASGFLGTSLKISLQRRGFTTFSLGINKSNDYQVDLTNETPLFNNSFNIIIHAAGKAHSVPKTFKEKKAFFDVNFQGTINLCKAIDSLVIKPEAFIFISTVSVYGLDHGMGITEDSPLNGSTPYAKSKIQAEEYLKKWADKKGIKLGILRLPLIVGPNAPGNLGDMIRGIKSGRYLSIGNASAKKSMVWVDDIGEIIPKLAEIGGIFNLTDQYHPTLFELETNISKCFGKKKPLSIPFWFARILGKTGDFLGKNSPINSEKLKKIISSLTFDDSKAQYDLNWKPNKVLTKICEIERF